MSSASPTDPTQSASQAAAPSKKKNNKKKKNANKAKPTVDTAAAVAEDGAAHDEDGDEGEEEPDTPGMTTAEKGPASPVKADPSPATVNGHAATNGHAVTSPTTGAAAASAEAPSDTSAKLEAMSQEREALRTEVGQLRKQLESMQENQDAELSQLKTDLEESEAAKEHAETQYQTLLGRVEKIKETLGERLKRDKADLEEANKRIEELEAQNEGLVQTSRKAEEEAGRLREESTEQTRELASLRSRSNLSQQNWLKEKEDVARQVQHLRAELESTSNAMGEWEVIAMEERSMRENLSEKVADLEEQLGSVREAYERAAMERDTQSQAIDGLQRALQEIQEARKKELREMVESSEEQLEAMKRRVQEADRNAEQAEAAKATLAKELERMAPFEKEVKEKNLLIGKLRHDAIGLNEHLIKALKYIKKTKPEEAIDRQIVTNHFLQFLALDRTDPRKFQILQIIAGLLNWTEEQREQAGLARPGTSTNSLRLPVSPFHRTPSSPALNTEFFTEPSSATGKESLSDLWADFLQRSVEEASVTAPSRKGSMSSVTTAATRPDTRGGQN